MMKKTQKENKKKKDISNFFIIGGVLIISASIIFIKRSTEAAAVIPVETVIQGETEDVTLAVIPTEPLRKEENPEERLDRLISEKEPVFAFFHSNNCQLCLEMIDIVNEVYPEYQNEVSLIDINVYDEINRNLLIRAKIQAIPTQFFIYRSGEVNRSIGMMSADQLRSELEKMSGDS